MNVLENLRGNRWVVVLCLGLFMALLDTTIVNIAIPSIIEGIDASLDEIPWVLNAYVLVFAPSRAPALRR
jgi:MFS family permease